MFSAHLGARAEEWGRNPATDGAYIVLTLTNGRQFPARLERIDASGPGLHVRSVRLDGEQLPRTLDGHHTVGVRIEYRVVNCAHIDRDRDLQVTTRRGPWSRTVAVHVEGFWDAPDGMRTYSGRDPYAVGYQYGITREACAGG
jgi:hypothetical protein